MLSITNFSILCAAAHAVRLETTSQYLDTAAEVAMTLADGDNMVTEHEFELAFGAEFSKLYDAEDGLNGNGAVDNVAQWLSTNDAPTYQILRARAAVKKAVYEPASEALDAAKLMDAEYQMAFASATKIINAIIVVGDLNDLSFIDHPLKDAYLSIEGEDGISPTNDELQSGLTTYFVLHPDEVEKVEKFIQDLTSAKAAVDAA